MERTEVEAEILNYAGNLLSGQADEEECKRVTKLAKENDCFDILARELSSVHKILNH